MAAVLNLNLATSLPAQTTTERVPAATAESNSSTTQPQTHNATLPSSSTDQTNPSSTISKANKASSLIGMEVRNPQNERLGEIKDLVVDLNSGKIGYLVLSVGGFLGIGDKYVAVPPNSLRAAPDQDRLVLNADKAKIQNAPGFAKSSWPDVNSSSWTADSSYWLSDQSAQGTAASTRSGTATESDRAQSGSSRSQSDRTDRASSAAPEKSTYRGRITAINPENRTMTVEGPAGPRDFKFTARPTITLKDSRNPSLTDLKVGYPVAVGYHEENGTFMAHSILRTDTPEVR